MIDWMVRYLKDDGYDVEIGDSKHGRKIIRVFKNGQCAYHNHGTTENALIRKAYNYLSNGRRDVKLTEAFTAKARAAQAAAHQALVAMGRVQR